MFAGNDVIGLVWFPGVFFVEQAVLASKAGSVLHQHT
jgi:hypothetical protein